MDTRIFSISVFFLFFLLLCTLQLSASAEEFSTLDDYQIWAAYEGYPKGLLTPTGINGINQDYFHSLPGSAEYSSGKIVIGDSRSCQLGIYQNRRENTDFAVFAVWGGHYVYGTTTPIMTGNLLSDFEQCFHEQIRTRRKCTVYFFATVNDYDYSGNNFAYIASAVSSAELFASMTYEYEGTEYHPEVILIGFDGAGDIFGISREVFNRYVDQYNRELREAAGRSAVLNESTTLFTTVSEITEGNTSFISDGLHYSDSTLQEIISFINSFPGGGITDTTSAGKSTKFRDNGKDNNMTIPDEYPVSKFNRIGN